MNRFSPCAVSGTDARPAHGASPAARSRLLPRVIPLYFLFAVLCLAGCANQAASPEWKLGQEGQAMYYFLVQLDAASSGDIDTYMDAGRKLLDIEPNEASFLEMADFSMRRGRLEDARITARSGLTHFPASLPLTLIISDTYIQQESITEAAETLAYFMKGNPGNKDALQELARVYLVGQRYEEFDSLLKTVPAADMTPYLHYVKARSLLDRNRLAEGERELRRVLREAPDMTDAWVNLGIAQQLQGKHNDSIPAFRKAVRHDPENLGLWLRLINAEIQAKRSNDALRTLAEAPQSVSLRMETGMLFVEAGQFSRARDIFLSVREAPDAPEEVHLYLAALAVERMNNPSEALSELAVISPHSPLAERALRWRLQILSEAGKVQESVPIAREFAEQNPESAEFQVIYAQAAAAAGDMKTSTAILRNAQQKWPENVSVALYLASSLDPKTEKAEAMQLMELVVRHQPRNAFALNYVGYMLAEDNRELDRAYELVARAMVEAPEDPHIADSLAWVFYRLGNFAEAWTAIRKSISLGGDHPTIWEHYGDIAVKVGNMAEARKGYSNALNGDPDDPNAIRAKLKELP